MYVYIGMIGRTRFDHGVLGNHHRHVIIRAGARGPEHLSTLPSASCLFYPRTPFPPRDVHQRLFLFSSPLFLPFKPNTKGPKTHQVYRNFLNIFFSRLLSLSIQFSFFSIPGQKAIKSNDLTDAFITVFNFFFFSNYQ